MQINFTVDTSQQNDLTQLAALAGALSGTPTVKTSTAVHVQTATKAKKEEPLEEENGGSASDLSNAISGERVTIEQVRAACGKKVAADCKKVFTDMGFAGLSVIPADRLADALEGVNKLKNK